MRPYNTADGTILRWTSTILQKTRARARPLLLITMFSIEQAKAPALPLRVPKNLPWLDLHVVSSQWTRLSRQ
jgi:hypothetical protein